MPLDSIRDRFPTEPEVDLGGKSARQYMDAYDTRNISYGSPYDQKDLGMVGQGLSDAYMSSIMELPMMAMEYLMPDDPYEAGVLQSGPQDRMREGEFKWQEHMEGQSQDPSYATGQDFGQALGVIADPFIDAPLMGIPALGKMMKLSPDTTAKMGSGVMGRLMDETGSVVAQQGDEVARIQRAKDMGFDVDETLYHGTNETFSEFNVEGKGKTSGTGAFFTDSPRIAETYHGGLYANPKVIPAYVKKGKNLRLEAGGRNWADIGYDDLYIRDGDNAGEMGFDVLGIDSREIASTDDIARAAKDAGYDSITIDDVIDSGPNSQIETAKEYIKDKYDIDVEPEWANISGDMFVEARDAVEKMYKSPNSMTVVFDAKNIRSKFAKFDKSKKASKDILASGALGTMGYAASKGRE